MCSKNIVIVSDFAKKHYLKKITDKKNKKRVLEEWDAFEMMLQKIEKLFQKDRAVFINEEDNIAIYKLDFQIRDNNSAKNGGGRVIVAWDKKEKIVEVLLVYTKQHIQMKGKETVWWKKKIKDNFSKYGNIIGCI